MTGYLGETKTSQLTGAGYSPFTWGFSEELRYCQIFALEKWGSVQSLSPLFSLHC